MARKQREALQQFDAAVKRYDKAVENYDRAVESLDRTIKQERGRAERLRQSDVIDCLSAPARDTGDRDPPMNDM
jgi:hypothetical protein